MLPNLIAVHVDVWACTSYDAIPYCGAQFHRVGILQDPPNGVSIEAGRVRTHGLPLGVEPTDSGTRSESTCGRTPGLRSAAGMSSTRASTTCSSSRSIRAMPSTPMSDGRSTRRSRSLSDRSVPRATLPKTPWTCTPCNRAIRSNSARCRRTRAPIGPVSRSRLRRRRRRSRSKPVASISATSVDRAGCRAPVSYMLIMLWGTSTRRASCVWDKPARERASRNSALDSRVPAAIRPL